MALVWAFHEHIKIHSLDDILHILVDNDLIHITYGTYHIATLLRAIHQLGIGLESQHNV